MLTKCRFLDANKVPKGREYTYATNDDVEIGEIVTTVEGKEVVVTELNIPQDTVTGFESKLKYVSKSSKTLSESKTTVLPMHEIIDAESVEVEQPKAEIILPEISVNKDNLAIVEQLPVITERLKLASVEIESIVNAALVMKCTEENRQAIKKSRAKLNALKGEFDKRRISIKKELDEPYNTFNQNYKAYISDPIDRALISLDKQISAIENGIKQKLQDDAEGYFYEYLASKNIDWLTWEQSGIKIGISDNRTALKREAAKFIDKVCDDIALIETQDYKAEITVEYRKELNLAKSISAVNARIKAVEEQERLRREHEERRKAVEEQRRLQADALEKARQNNMVLGGQSSIPLYPQSTQQAFRLEPPKTLASAKSEQSEVKKYAVAFKVWDETPERIAQLKRYLIDNGYEYTQVSLKNIITEVS